MTETIEQIIEYAKEQKAKAAAIDAEAQNPQPQAASDARAPSAFEQTVANVTDAMHNSLKAELVELHAFIPEKLLSASYEVALIAQAMYKEQRFMSGFRLEIDEKGHEKWSKEMTVLDRVTWLQNEVLVQEALENARILMRQLSAINGFRSEQGVKNVASAVSGESARLMAQNPLLIPQPTNSSLAHRVKKWFAGGQP